IPVIDWIIEGTYKIDPEYAFRGVRYCYKNNKKYIYKDKDSKNDYFACVMPSNFIQKVDPHIYTFMGDSVKSFFISRQYVLQILNIFKTLHELGFCRTDNK